MRRIFLVVLVLLAVAPVAPAAAEPARVVAELAVDSKVVAVAPALFPLNLGDRRLGEIVDVTFTSCFGQSFNDCSGQGTFALRQGLDTPFFVAAVFRKVVATGAVTPASFPVTLQPGQQLKVLFQWAADRLGPASDGAVLQATPAGGIPQELEIQLRGNGTPPLACVPVFGVLCLNEGRFKIEGHYLTPAAIAGEAKGESLTADTGYLWFFDPNNVEAMIKVLDGCGLNDRYWVFAGGLTNVRTLVTVTDTQNNATRIYVNPQNRPFQPIQDTAAFATCP